jgi:hypothetical protein
MSNFDLEKFSDLIDSMGVDMKYYQSTLCSCLGGDGQPDPDCSCSNGYRYPGSPVEAKLLRTSVDFKSIPEELGRILQGGCQITIPRQERKLDVLGLPYYEDLTIFDRVSVGDVFSITNRTRRATDILKKGVRDSLRAFDVQEIFSVTKVNTTYTEGTDYTFSGTTITWGVDKGPNDGEFYTVEFECLVQYVVWDDMAKDRGGDNDVLPKRVLCKLRQFLDFSSSPIDSIDV